MSLCFFFKQKTAYEMRISDWSSDVCSSDLPAAVYEDQCSIKTEAAQVDLRIAGVALSCSRDAGIGAEKVAKECVEVGRPRALDFLARENRIGLRLILAARDVGIERPAALAEHQNFRDILLAVHIAVAGADIGGEQIGLLVPFIAPPGAEIGRASCRERVC